MLIGTGLVIGALGVIFVIMGLDRADQLASVLGAFIGLAGLGTSVYGLSHRPSEGDSTGTTALPAAPGAPPVTSRLPSHGPERAPAQPEPERRYGGDHIDFHGGTFHGPVTGKSVRHDSTGQDPDDPA
ncbi:hypothetical protein [Streptosporangium roseum]|uniref:hypothetical protein n=1 Tax=Streptosporangium roseum TaxID=2001 RepID=UPI00332E528D